MSVSSKIALAMSSNGASFEEVHNHLEKITDEHAIRFGEWLIIAYNGKRMLETYNIAELLEIYKKESGAIK